MVGAGCVDRVDRRLGRGRRPHARVQPDPGASAPFQHPLPRRQVVPLPGPHRRRDVAARAGPAWRQAEDGPLLRTLRARMGDPRHARRPHPGLPGPHLLERVLRSARAGRPALSLLRHRTVCRTLRPEGHGRHPGELSRPRRRDGRLPGGQRPAGPPAPRSRDARERGPAGVRAGGQAPGSAVRRAARSRVPGDGADAARRPRCDRDGRGRPRGRVPGVLRPGRSGAGSQGLGRRPRRGARPRPADLDVHRTALHGAAGGPAARPRPRDARGRRPPAGLVGRPPRHRGCGSPSPSAAPSDG